MRRAQVSGKEYRLSVSLKEGISRRTLRRSAKINPGEGPRAIRAQGPGDELRVSAKKKDDLQDAITLLKGPRVRLRPQFVQTYRSGHVR